MQREITSIKARLNGMNSKLDGIESANRRIMAMLSRLVGDVAEMRQEFSTKGELATLRSEMNQRFDGFAALHKEMTYSRAVHWDRLNEHEKRLKKLEPRRA